MNLSLYKNLVPDDYYARKYLKGLSPNKRRAVTMWQLGRMDECPPVYRRRLFQVFREWSRLDG